MDIFSRKSIQRIINHQWKNWQYRFYLQIFIPYLFLLVCFNFFWFLAPKIYENDFHETISGTLLELTMIIILAGFPIYFLVLEVILIFKSPGKYFSNILAVFRVSPQVSVLILLGMLIKYKI